MKQIIFIIYILMLCSVTSVRADLSDKMAEISGAGEKTTKFVSGLIPGEGLTEV